MIKFELVCWFYRLWKFYCPGKIIVDMMGFYSCRRMQLSFPSTSASFFGFSLKVAIVASNSDWATASLEKNGEMNNYACVKITSWARFKLNQSKSKEIRILWLDHGQKSNWYSRAHHVETNFICHESSFGMTFTSLDTNALKISSTCAFEWHKKGFDSISYLS